MTDWLKPPKFADETKTHQAFILHVLLWVLIFIPIPYTLLTLLSTPESATEILIQTVVSESINIFLMVLLRRGHVHLASALQVGTFWIFFTVISFTSGGVNGPAYMLGYASVIVVAGILLGGRGATIMTALSLISGGILLYAQSSGLLVVESTPAVSAWIPSLLFFPLIAVVQNLAFDSVQRALEQARSSEARYRSLLENIPVTTYINRLAPFNPTEYVSPQIAGLLGYPHQEFVSDPDLWIKRIHPHDRAAVLAESERSTATGERFQIDYRLLRSDDRVVWVRDDAVLVRDSGKDAPYWLGVWTDITEHKRAENEVRRLEELYRRAIEAAGAVPYFRDFQTQSYTFMGEGILSMTGYSADEMTPSLWNTLEQQGFPRGDLASLSYEEADRLSEEGKIRRWECDYRITTRDGGTRWLADSAVQVRDEYDQRIGVIGILQDITGRRGAVEEIHRLNTELEQRVSERTSQLEAANQELEAFSYSVSHDLRTPLRTIRGYSDILVKDFSGQLDPTAQDYLQRVSTAASDMGQLIEGLLTLSRLSRSTIRRVTVDLTAIADDIIAGLRQQEPDRPVAWAVDEGMSVEADPSLMRNVLENLLGNAWKYSSKNPAAAIEFRAGMRDGKKIYLVHDNGVGFDVRYADKLFGAFQRLHSAHEFPGYGIGLATVQRIIRRHGGQIWAESEPGKGATFYFTLR
jgi:PAS domain S-box-containing protein